MPPLVFSFHSILIVFHPSHVALIFVDFVVVAIHSDHSIIVQYCFAEYEKHITFQ